MAATAMSGSSCSDPALAFLDGPAPDPAQAAWPASQVRLALVPTVFLGSMLLFWLEYHLLAGQRLIAVVAAAMTTVAALETSRWCPGRSAVVVPVLVAALVGAIVSLRLGLTWRACGAWAAAFVPGAVVILAGVARLPLLSIPQQWLMRQSRGVAIVGDGPTAERVAARLSGRLAGRKRVTRYGLTSTETASGGRRGAREALLCDCHLGRLETVILATEAEQWPLLPPLMQALQSSALDLYVPAPDRDRAPPPLVAGSEPSSRQVFGELELLPLRLRRIRGAAAVLKRGFDLLGASALILFIAPLLGIIALAIKMETRGPILFRQLRVGYNNGLFPILKFRSMYVDASDLLAKQQTVRGDKRITRVGQFIRKLSLDELPQLFNVVSGEMSLVGPRPHAPGTSIGGRRVHTLVDAYDSRHLVRPGITGLAQVRGLRGGLHDRAHVLARVASDLEYIEHWSFWLDIRILFETVLLEVRDKRGV